MKKTTIKTKFKFALTCLAMITGQIFAGTNVGIKEFTAKTLALCDFKKNADKILEGKLSNYELYDFDLTNFTKLLASNQKNQTEVRLNFGNHQWTLNVRENQVRSADMLIRTLTLEGIVETSASEDVRTYMGFNNGDLDYTVRLATYFETMMGVINDRYGKYIIEPLSRYDASASKTQFIIFKPEDVLTKVLPCGVPSRDDEILYTSAESASRLATATKATANSCYNVDIAVAFDFLAYKKFGTNASSQIVELEVLNVINLMNEIYKGLELAPTPKTITFRLVEVFAEAIDKNTFNSSLNGGQNSGDIMLHAFHNWVISADGFKKPYGVATIWTGRGAQGDPSDLKSGGVPISGVAHGSAPGANLDPNIAYPILATNINGYNEPHNLVKWGYYNSWGSAVIQAHETGHNFSCAHNGSTWGPNLMTNGPSLQSYAWTATEYASINVGITAALKYPERFKTCDVVAPIINYSTSNGGSLNGSSCFGNINFMNKSTGASLWEWDFGDNTKSTERDPIHRYTSIGIYTVTLKAMSGSQTTIKTSTIQVNNIQNNNPLDSVGPMTSVNTIASTASSIPSLFARNEKLLYFKVSRPTLINSIDVPLCGAVASGSITIEIYDAYGVCVFKKIANVKSTMGNCGSNITNPVVNKIILDAELPEGDYSIGVGKCTYGLYALKGNYSLPFTTAPSYWVSPDLGFPFSNKNTVTPLITITKQNNTIAGGSATSPYYYFFNWRVKELNCIPTNVVTQNNLFNVLKIYPNPVSGSQVNIEFTQALKHANIEILNVLGQVVLSKSLQTVQVGVNTVTLPSDLAKGTYVFKINSENGTHAQKLIIE